MKVKRILSVVLAIVMSIGIVGISDVNNAKANSNKEIYDIGGLGEYDIYLDGSRTIDVVYFDENMELIMNPDLSNYSILWEKFNKNTNKWEYYSNNRKLEIINAKKEDFTKYRITLTNKKENGAVALSNECAAPFLCKKNTKKNCQTSKVSDSWCKINVCLNTLTYRKIIV